MFLILNIQVIHLKSQGWLFITLRYMSRKAKICLYIGIISNSLCFSRIWYNNFLFCSPWIGVFAYLTGEKLTNKMPGFLSNRTSHGTELAAQHANGYSNEGWILLWHWRKAWSTILKPVKDLLVFITSVLSHAVIIWVCENGGELSLLNAWKISLSRENDS